DQSRDEALALLGQALEELGEYAAKYDVPLIYEPLNRYETNLICTVADGVALLQSLTTTNVKLLADLFHMNIEEANIADGIRAGKGYIGHVHFVDSNRRPAGLGHIDYEPIAAALNEIGYAGYASAEAFAYPDPDAAAKQTIDTYKKYFK
ncbi:MAG TPA: sugar phosphate isomerase/epimerase family protein, partial [Pirellulaceae bacterium]|nr:sugar phosphate isomerase/epimerase family protein [Pirellulaceae bacterium]